MQRLDGRLEGQLRPVEMEVGYINTAPGAVLMQMGETKVICTVSCEERVPPFLIGSQKGWLTAEYSMLPGSSPRRVAREGASGKINSRSREIQRLIGRSLRAAIDLERLGERTLYIDCDVIQADGGTRTASITGAYVALCAAIDRLIEDGVLKESPLQRAVAAISVGVVEGQVLLDLCYEEDVRAETDMNVVMAEGGGIIEIQGTAEGMPFTREQTDLMLDFAGQGISELLQLQTAALKS
jgi:ribonuclease PH